MEVDSLQFIMTVRLIVPLLLIVDVTNAFNLKYFNNNAEIPQPDSLITNAKLAAKGQFKYQVGLQITKGQNTSFCGGALIDTGWILTAAHCIIGATGMFGIYAYMGNTKFLYGELVSARYGIYHEKFDSKTMANDIGLIRIPYFSWGKNPMMAEVHLPPLTGPENSYVDENVIASGWGIKNDLYVHSANQLLQYARLKIVPNSDCLISNGSNMVGDTYICAQGLRGSENSACVGDSGGPIVTESGVLLGIASFVADDCTLRYPVVYTRISSYRSWIKSITGF